MAGSKLTCSLAISLLTLAGWLLTSALPAAEQKKPNVLFIATDDFNAWVHHLGGHPQAKTPHIDALAGRGVSMFRAYCAAPVCNPSRAALMSGLRPSSSGVYDNNTDWRTPLKDVVTLPLHFQKQGYFVCGAGKIYHDSYRRPSDWTEYLEREGGDPKLPQDANDGVGGIKFAPLDCNDEDMADYRTVTYCIEQLNQQRDRPKFIACGLHKPHMPWNVPRKYYDLYPLKDIVLPKVLESDLDDIPPAGVAMARPQGDHAEMLKSGRWKEAVQAYLAAGAFADAMIGRMMAALDKSPERDNTIVVLWGDHGWHLGEKQHWRKFALWEEATRTPLVWIVPGVTKAGGVCQTPVDFMSIYPTLCDLCGLPKPPHVEGQSIRPLLADPAAAWDRPALTTHGYQNHAVRSSQHRYIRYANGDEELYDERKDPLEWSNLAGKSELASVKSELARFLPDKNVRLDKEESAAGEQKADKKKNKAAKKKAKN